MARTVSIHDHFDLYLTPMTLTFSLREKMFHMALFLLEDNNCAKLFWNPCIDVKVMTRTSSIYDHFDLYLTPCDLDCQPTWKTVSNGTFPPRGQYLCKINLKSMHKCTSSIHVYDHFDLYLTPVTLAFNLPKKNVSHGTSPPQGQKLCQNVLKSMHYCTSYGPDKSGRTHGHTHIHRTKIVTTMSSLPASGLDKNTDTAILRD